MKFLKKISVPQVLIQLIICFYVFDIWKATNVFIIVLGLYWLFHGNFKSRIINTIRNPYLLPLITFFLLNLIGILWTENYPYAGQLLERRLSLLIFPFIISGISINRGGYYKILLTFVLACSLAALIGLFLSYQEYNITGDPAYFYSNHLVSYIGTQGVYFAIYSNLSLLFTIYLWTKRKEFPITLWQVIVLISFLLTITFLSAGRTSILTLVLCAVIYVLYIIVKERKFKLGTLVFVFLILSLSGGVYLFPNTVQRFKSVTNIEFDYENKNPVNQFRGELKKENWNGLTLRLAVWSCGIEVVKNNFWFGTGTGDSYDDLMKVVEARKFYYMMEQRGGIHSQYMDALIAWGGVGFLFFMYSFLYPAYLAIKDQNYLFVLVTFLFLMAFLTESVLSRYSGIVLFGLFSSLLAFQPNPQN